jgi:hypothetical protein
MAGPVHVHGVGVLDGRLIHCGSPPPPRPATATLGMALRGVVTLYLGREAILPDPLGASLIFIWEDGSDWAISGDLRALVHWLKGRGVRLRRSPLYGSVMSVIGNGSLGLTSYERVRALPSHHYITFRGKRFTIHRYPLEEYLSEPVSLAQALDEAEAEIAGNVRAAATAGFGNVIVHLTGGFDSRLVTAACLRDGFEFVTYCSGPIQSPDKRTAHGICASLGMPMTHHAGFVETKTAPSLEARLLDEMDSVAGMSLFARRGSGTVGTSGTLILSGGLGERFRTKGHIRGDEPMRELVRQFWGAMAFPRVGEVGLLAPDAAEVLALMVEEALEACGEPGPERLERFRMRNVHNYTFGLVSRRYSEFTPRFDPLYSPAGVRAARVGGVEERLARRVAYELMNRFDARLSRFPFGDEVWPEELGAPAPVAFASTQPHYVDEPQEAIPLWVGEPRASRAQAEKIGQMRAASWQVMHWEETRRCCLEALRRSPSLARMFNPTMIRRLTGREPVHRKHLRTLYQLTAVLLWIGEDWQGSEA